MTAQDRENAMVCGETSPAELTAATKWYQRGTSAVPRIVHGRHWLGVIVGRWYLILKGPSHRPLFSERNRHGCRVLPLARGWRIVLKDWRLDV